MMTGVIVYVMLRTRVSRRPPGRPVPELLKWPVRASKEKIAWLMPGKGVRFLVGSWRGGSLWTPQPSDPGPESLCIGSC